MHEYSLLGLIITVVFIWITNIYPGGIIVPFYLVLFINQPLRIAGTVAIGLVTFWCYRFLCRWFILFGKRRFLVMIAVSGIITYLVHTYIISRFSLALEFRVIGLIIPGLMANQFERQGVLITLLSLITVLTVTYVAGRILFSLL